MRQNCKSSTGNDLRLNKGMCRTCIIRTFIDFLNFLLFQQTICPTATYKEGVRKQGVVGSRRIPKRGRRIGFIACNGDVTGLQVLCRHRG